MSSVGAISGSAYQPYATAWAGQETARPKSGGGCSSCGGDECSGCGPKAVAATDETKRDDPFQLSDDEQKAVKELKARDQEVRAHEQAHKAVGGQYTGSISYNYQKGPDGRSYAVGGEVPIDASEIPGDPAATIEKMRVVKAAALAPAEPSGQDRKVAAQADAAAAKARAELNAQRDEEPDPNDPETQFSMSVNQRLAEMKREDAEASATGAPDTSGLAAYAANAYSVAA